VVDQATIEHPAPDRFVRSERDAIWFGLTPCSERGEPIATFRPDRTGACTGFIVLLGLGEVEVDTSKLRFELCPSSLLGRGEIPAPVSGDSVELAH
jgi:hypothetical protein